MEILLNGIIILLWILFAMLSGYSEAGYWYYKYKTPVKRQIVQYEHQVWTMMRSIVMILIAILFVHVLEYGIYTIFRVISLIAVFPLFHDGMYYTIRNSYDNSYPMEWMATSKTSTAKFTLDFRTRLILAFIIAPLFYLAMILINKGI